MQRLVVTAFAGVVALMAGAVPPAPAAVTIGPPLTGYTPSYVTLGCGGCTLFNVFDGGTMQSAASPIDGVVVRWRLLSDFTVQTKLRVVRPGDAGHIQAVATSTPGFEESNDPQPIATRLPIAHGDFVGIDVASSSRAVVGGGWTVGEASPPLVDGEDRSFYLPGSNTLLLQADIEPDADRDGYGDETQDLCPTDASTHDTCPSPPPPPPPPTITNAPPTTTSVPPAGSVSATPLSLTPVLGMTVRRQHVAAVLRSGLRVEVRSTVAGAAMLTVSPSKADARRLRMRGGTVLAAAMVRFVAPGRAVVRLRFRATLRRRIDTRHVLHLSLRIALAGTVASRTVSLAP